MYSYVWSNVLTYNVIVMQEKRGISCPCFAHPCLPHVSPGLQDCQEAYSPYPNALLSVRFIITVGKIIMSDTQLEPGEIKEGDNVTMARKSALSRPSAVRQH